MAPHDGGADHNLLHLDQEKQLAHAMHAAGEAIQPLLEREDFAAAMAANGEIASPARRILR